MKATITSIQIPFPRHQPFSSYNRILAAFFAVKLTPTQIVIFNLALSLAANVTILAFGEQDRTLMAVAYGFLGMSL